MGILRKAKEFGIHLVEQEVVNLRLFVWRGPRGGGGGKAKLNIAKITEFEKNYFDSNM
jgi:hypothetical protein